MTAQHPRALAHAVSLLAVPPGAALRVEILRSVGGLPPHIVGTFEEPGRLSAGGRRHLLRVRPARARGVRRRRGADAPRRRSSRSAAKRGASSSQPGSTSRRDGRIVVADVPRAAAADSDLRRQGTARERLLPSRTARRTRHHRQPDAERRGIGPAHGQHAAHQPSGERSPLYRVLTRRVRATQHRPPAGHRIRGRSRAPHRHERGTAARRSDRRLLLRLHHRHAAHPQVRRERNPALRAAHRRPRARRLPCGAAETVAPATGAGQRGAVRDAGHSRCRGQRPRRAVDFVQRARIPTSTTGTATRFARCSSRLRVSSSPSSLSFARDGRLLVTPGCYEFDPR